MRRIMLCLATLVAITTASQAGIISATNSTPGNFDDSSGNRSVTFTGAEPGFDTGRILGVTLSINFAKADGESFNPPFPGGFSFLREIRFRLTGPGGQQVTLINEDSFNGGGLFDGTITFDQNALLVVNNNPNVLTAGTFRPTGAGSLNDYIGLNAAGNWTLFIEDTVFADSLRFRSFTLNIVTEVPEPASMAIFGGLVAIGGVVARRRMSKAAA